MIIIQIVRIGCKMISCMRNQTAQWTFFAQFENKHDKYQLSHALLSFGKIIWLILLNAVKTNSFPYSKKSNDIQGLVCYYCMLYAKLKSEMILIMVVNNSWSYILYLQYSFVYNSFVSKKIKAVHILHNEEFLKGS